MKRHIDEAICAIKAVIAQGGGMQKDRQSPQGYSFRSIETMDNILCGLTAEHGVNIYGTLLDKELIHGKTHKGFYQCHAFLTFRWKFVSAVDGSFEEVVTLGEAMDTGDKVANKATQASRKYALITTFKIPTAEDDTEIYVPPAPAPGGTPVEEEEPERKTRAKSKVGKAIEEAAAAREAAPEPEPAQPKVTYDPLELKALVDKSVTFEDMYKVAQAFDEAKVQDTHLHGLLIAKIRGGLSKATKRSEVSDAFELVSIYGDELKKDANEAWARVRNSPEAS